MDNGDARERVGGAVGGAAASSGVVCGRAGVRASVGEADPGDAGEGEEVRLVRLRAGTNEVGYAGCDPPLVQRGCPIVLDKWDGSKEGVSD